MGQEVKDSKDLLVGCENSAGACYYTNERAYYMTDSVRKTTKVSKIYSVYSNNTQTPRFTDKV